MLRYFHPKDLLHQKQLEIFLDLHTYSTGEVVGKTEVLMLINHSATILESN